MKKGEGEKKHCEWKEEKTESRKEKNIQEVRYRNGQSEVKTVKMREKQQREGLRKKGEERERGGRESQKGKSHAGTEKSGSGPRSRQYMWVQCYTKIFLLLFC